MGIFKRLFGPHQPMVCISRDELEDAIAGAIIRAQKEIAQDESNKSIDDPLTDSIRFISGLAAFTFILLCAFFAIATTLSFFPLSIDALSGVHAIPVWGRIFILLMAIVYGFWGVMLLMAIRKEKNREFLIAFFSAATSIAALIVALISIGK